MNKRKINLKRKNLKKFTFTTAFYVDSFYHAFNKQILYFGHSHG